MCSNRGSGHTLSGSPGAVSVLTFPPRLTVPSLSGTRGSHLGFTVSYWDHQATRSLLSGKTTLLTVQRGESRERRPDTALVGDGAE